MNRIIYLDNNATTVPLPIIRDRMASLLDEFANPSSPHIVGSRVRQKIEEARSVVATAIGASPEAVLFTSGGSESISWVMAQEWDAVLVSTVEHAAVLDAARVAAARGAMVVSVGVDESGSLREDEFAECLQECRAKIPAGRILVSLMLANNETGVIFPLERLASLVKEHEALFHVDAVQCIGKIPASVKNLQCDYLSLSAHKFHGIKGAGAVFRSGQAPLVPIIHGHHEHGLRGGTENVTGILAMGLAADEVVADFKCSASTKTAELRDLLESQLCQILVGTRINGAKSPRLPNTSNIMFPKRDGAMLVELLSAKGIMVSAGAACSTGEGPSHVLQAMGLSPYEANASVRFSLSNQTTRNEIEYVVQVVSDTVSAMIDVYRVNG